MQLSICIPTYNRARFLKECLESLVPQVKDKDNVEIVICDNNSSDNTKDVVEGFQKICKNIRYFKNPQNLGYSGNQVQCFYRAKGKYMAFLCDDDIYLEGAVKRILEVTAYNEYVFIALNYYAFLRNKNKVFKSNFAPEKDVVFRRAYDILNYPSVGHFSGFIFNLSQALKTLDEILSKRNFWEFEKHRGIVVEVAARVTLNSDLPAYFIGKRLLATRIPEKTDYDSLRHLCIDSYELFWRLYKEGLINDKDLEYRKKLVLDILPRAIISNSPQLNSAQWKEIYLRLNEFFADKARFRFICKPLLLAGRFYIFKIVFRLIRDSVRFIRRLWQKLHQ